MKYIKKMFTYFILSSLMLASIASCTKMHAYDKREEMAMKTVNGCIVKGEYDLAYSQIIELNISAETMAMYFDVYQQMNDERYYNFVIAYGDELKSSGHLPADYVLPGTSATTSSQSTTITAPAEPTPTPAPFTVEDMEPTPMWATGTVNIREGAGTDYKKVGSLKQYDEVTVNGVASTGWYRFVREDGSEAYVSNKFLSEEDPSDRTVYIYNEETEKIDKLEFTDTEPEKIDEVLEAMQEPEPTATPEPTPQPTPEPTIEPTPEPTATPLIPINDMETHPKKYAVYTFLAGAIISIIGVVLWIRVIRRK